MARTNENSSKGFADRSVRSLVELASNGSTARTLNLLAVWKRWALTEEYKGRPFFINKMLNRSIIVKHTLRPYERHMLERSKTSTTKVILPIDITDLRSGARSFFVGEPGYANILKEVSGPAGLVDKHDLQLLELLDTLPSLDPFLMRERLQQGGYSPARCYFDLSESDARQMLDFARHEMMPLIGLSFGDVDAISDDRTARLASKILGSSGGAVFEPLRRGMGMNEAEFEEGVFCWKGFIYYKWTLTSLLPRVGPILNEIKQLKQTGQATTDEKIYIGATRDRLVKSIQRTCESVRASIKVYDDAYADLTRNGRPLAFREFLLRAPELFYELGERLGAVQHVTSFWRYRFPVGARVKLTAEEVCDLLADFESSLSFEKSKAEPPGEASREALVI